MPPPGPDPSLASLGHSAAAAHGRASALPPLPPLRLLLLDNFDSYTHNLVHACAALCGTRPLVRFNTISAAELRELLRVERVDCVVVSPGPGRPDQPKDFGVCAHLYGDEEFKHVPVLGVCLGLQGQFSTVGGRIVAASEPMHGRLSAIAHDDRGLFAGLSQGFRVVRYNSLVADAGAVPAGLEVSAWATVEGSSGADAVREVMGLRDIIPPVAAGARPRPPRESVQFHPESICTEQGQQLLHNWFRMVVEHKRALASAGQPVEWCEAETDAADDGAANGVAAAARDVRAASRFTLQCRRLPFFVDSEQAFQLLYDDGVSNVAGAAAASPAASSSRPSAFWLDSSKVELGRSRFSYMGDNAGPLSYNLVYSVRDPLAYHVTQARSAADGADECVVQRVPLDRGERIWHELEQRVDERNCSVHMLHDGDDANADVDTPMSAPLPFNFEAGLVGYIGYAMRKMCTPDSLPPIHMHFDPPTAAAAAASASPVSPASSSSPSIAAAASASEPASSSDFRVPDLAFLFADRILVFDHQERHCYLLCLCEKDQDSAASVAAGRAWMQQTQERLCALSDVAASSAVSPIPAAASSVAAVPSASSPTSSSSSSSSITSHSHWFKSESEYLHAIRQCLGAIRDGESYEVCLTNQLDMAVQVAVPSSASSSSASSGGRGGVRGSIRPFDYYRTLRRINPAAYAAFFRFRYDHFSAAGGAGGSGAKRVESSRPLDAATDSWSVCCSSPERFLQVDRSRGAESKPIKGTLPRGASPAEDELLKRRLAASTKDFAENLMIVDLLRNDLGRVCTLGSVAVPKLMEVESYATVHNLVSTVRGKLASGRSTFHLLQAAFPPGSMTGAPKLRTCQILAVLEKEPGAAEEEEEGDQLREEGADGSAAAVAPVSSSSSSEIVRRRPRAHRERGIYSGCIGYIGINGAMSDLNVVIRTAIVQERVRVVAPAAAAAPASAVAAAAVPSGDSAVPAQPAPSTVYSTHFRIGAGGAIVYLSDPAEEYAEVHLKTKALVNAIQVATQELKERIAQTEKAVTPSA